MSIRPTPGAAAPKGAPAAAPDPTADPAGIEFRGVTVTGHGDFVMLDDLNLRVEKGEVVALLGPSGAGKTTALRAVAGFVQPSAGRILINGQDVTDRPTRNRGLGMVVQSYALFPHMTVTQNVAYGLKTLRMPRDQRAERVKEVLELVGMTQFAARHPRQLSGGQQQRVAIARALAPSPSVLLLDEPLSALDAQLRHDMLGELASLHRELTDMTMLYVTHGQNEALTLADRIAVMANSRMVECAEAQTLFRNPRYDFTARFLGSANVIPARVTSATTVALGADLAESATVCRTEHAVDTAASVCLRPHRLHLSAGEAPASDANRTSFVVEDVQWGGAIHSVRGRAYGTTVTVESLEMRTPPSVGQELCLSFDAEDAVVLAASSELADDGGPVRTLVGSAS